MKKAGRFLLTMVIGCLIFIVQLPAQAPSSGITPSKTSNIPEIGLFATDKILEVSISGNTIELLNDRDDNPKYHDLNFKYMNEDSLLTTLPVEIKARGHFRKLRANCLYPPLQIHFLKSDALKYSVFKNQDKLKLVMPCKSEEYVIREWLVYKLYNLVTPKSFRARLVSMKLENTKKNKTNGPFYGILLEEEKEMAKRNGMVAVTRKLQPQETEEESFLTMTVFQYLIGNTDWSIQFQQNIKLLAQDLNTIAFPVAYDFDHSGLVDAPYAKPAAELLMSSVMERRYRGYCVTDMKTFDSVIALFNGLKEDIYRVYTDCTLLEEKYIKSTIKYLDKFYATINDAGYMKKEFGYPCDKNGTGNVVIKGLREE